MIQKRLKYIWFYASNCDCKMSLTKVIKQRVWRSAIALFSNLEISITRNLKWQNLKKTDLQFWKTHLFDYIQVRSFIRLYYYHSLSFYALKQILQEQNRRFCISIFEYSTFWFSSDHIPVPLHSKWFTDQINQINDLNTFSIYNWYVYKVNRVCKNCLIYGDRIKDSINLNTQYKNPYIIFQ